MNEFTIDQEYKIKLNPETKHWDTYQFGKLLAKSTDKLFKYYSLNLYNIDALLRTYFYLANPGDFNDPFDCNINLCEDIGDMRVLKTVKRNSYKNLGVCTFSETIDNHLMWAHYTNNYNGFVLEFNGDNIQGKINKEAIKRYTLTRVIYPENPIRISKDYPFAEHYVLTTKFKHWEYEKEWRMIAEFNLIKRETEYFPETVKGIYIGFKIPDDNESAYRLILEICSIKFPSIPIYIVYPHPTDLKLQFEKVWG